jgi:DNA-binding MarR family transcriptional regulator
MRSYIRHIPLIATALHLLCVPVAGEDLDTTLGLNRRVGFRALGPSRTPFSYGQPIETIAIPEGLEIPLQATSEALTFYAAYRARNYRAMAAVGAMSAWGGTLRRGIDAVAGSSDEVSLEALGKLTEREIAILGYLWHKDGRSGSELYREMGAGGTWTDLATELKDMEKAHLIRKTRAVSHDVFAAEVTATDVRRAAIASGNSDRMIAVFLAMKEQNSEPQTKVNRGSTSTGHRVETQ